jgi:hypothetical protein
VKTMRRRVTEDVDFSKTPATGPNCTPDVELTLAVQNSNCNIISRYFENWPEYLRHTRISKRTNYCWVGEEPHSGLSHPRAILRWDHIVNVPYGWGRYLLPESYIAYTYSIQTKINRVSLQRVSRLPLVLRCDQPFSIPLSLS